MGTAGGSGRRFAEIRGFTAALARPLSAEDAMVQSMPDCSPTKWHLAHTSWFFETFVLARAVPALPPFDPAFAYLFNSYYEAVGERHCRPRRGVISRPSLDEVSRYRAHVDKHVLGAIEEGRIDAVPGLSGVLELGLQHEQQHQELIVTDIKHALAASPLRPAYHARPADDPSRAAAPVRWLAFAEGIHEIGHDGSGFAFDNETPRHKVFLRAFELASRPVTSGEYLAFMADGGYTRHELWLSDGWDRARAEAWAAPLYWERQGETWRSMTLAGMRDVALAEPVCHLSFYEADAYARWAGARLPTEAEWEVGASAASAGDRNFAEAARLHPAPAHDRETPGAAQMFGDVWEWTSSAYLGYPGFRALEGALGEYNGKFMSGQMVLRGGSCATPRAHIRATYRNFFRPDARWQFSGVRLAREV
jgi:ergothioneine biosynthesis protein EgtB